jgi:hypothetical protein
MYVVVSPHTRTDIPQKEKRLSVALNVLEYAETEGNLLRVITDDEM